MTRAPHRTPITGSALIRLLAALQDAPAPAPKDSFADGLCRWFDWTDAIALSAALDSPAAPVAPVVDSGTPRPATPSAAGAEERECARVRQALARLAAPVPAAPPDRSRLAPLPAAAPVDPADFSPHRQRYVGWQKAMETSLGPLRRRLRASLTAASPPLARLAALDVVMEKVVGAHERHLLAGVPAWLEQRFERVRRDEPGAWQGLFDQDMREVLLAELDLRMQPLDGLLAALRGPTTPDRP